MIEKIFPGLVMSYTNQIPLTALLLYFKTPHIHVSTARPSNTNPRMLIKQRTK